MNELIKDLIERWEKERQGWLETARIAEKGDPSVSERSNVRATTLQGCIDDLRTMAKKAQS